MSALRDQIKREISEYKRVCKEQGRLDWGRWFNNFYCNLPEGLPEGTLSVGRTGCRAVTPQNISLRELGVSNLSELRLNQSFAGFYNAIDDALKAERISVAKVVRCQELFRHFVMCNDGARQRTHNLLMDIVTPAYMRLREQGYTHYDLAQ